MVVYRINNLIVPTFTSGHNIMAVLNANDDRFSTLIRAIQVAGLTDTLSKGKIIPIFHSIRLILNGNSHEWIEFTDGPFTLYAPTNDAFRSLPTDALNKLLGEPAQLKQVLLGHVTKGTYFLNVLNSRSSGVDIALPTLDGNTNKIMIDGNSK